MFPFKTGLTNQHFLKKILKKLLLPSGIFLENLIPWAGAFEQN
jgi:hypothetical protein